MHCQIYEKLRANEYLYSDVRVRTYGQTRYHPTLVSDCHGGGRDVIRGGRNLTKYVVLCLRSGSEKTKQSTLYK